MATTSPAKLASEGPRRAAYQRGPDMGTLVEIRNVPEDVHRTLKSRAATAGVSLSEYPRTVPVRTAARPTPAGLAARTEARGARRLGQPSEVVVRHLRDYGE